MAKKIYNGLKVKGLSGDTYSLDVTGTTISTNISTTSISASSLNVIGTLKYIDGNQDIGKLLTTDSLGNATWQSPTIGGNLTFFFTNTTSDIGVYKYMFPDVQIGPLQTISNAGVVSGQLLTTEVTFSGQPNLTFYPAGVVSMFIDAANTNTGKSTRVYFQLYKRTTGGTETLMGTSTFSDVLTGVQAHYFTDLVITGTSVNLSDRLVVKIYAAVTGAGPAPDISLYIEDGTAARIELPSFAVSTLNFVPYTGATRNVNLGPYNLIANNLTANVISGTTYLGLPTDITITGGTVSGGTATYTNTTGGTFSVTGFTTHWSASTGTFAIVTKNSNSIASGTLAISIGSATTASGNYSFAEGQGTSATTTNSHAEGRDTLASGLNSHVEGHGTTASGDEGSHAEGLGSVASGTNGSHAEGYNTVAIGESSHSEGGTTTAIGDFSHAEGKGNVASGLASHAEGGVSDSDYPVLAFGLSSHAEGAGTLASGDTSHAEGSFTTASGFASHSEGENTLASGNLSHVEGQGTTASGGGSHAEGLSTIASGLFSHAEGNGTTASGVFSHAGGQGNKALADNSAAIGGSGNTINTGATNSVVLGGTGITATTSGVVYVPNLNIQTEKQIYLPSGGTNPVAGVVTLVGGTVIITTNKVTNNSLIWLTTQGGTITNVGGPYISSRTPNTSFVITSSNPLDGSNVGWWITEQY